MAEEEKAESQENVKKGSKLKLILIILIVLILLGGGAFFYFFIMKGGDSSQNENQNSQQQTEEAQSQNSKKFGPLYSFDTFIVNLSDSGGRRYLKVGMQVELSSPNVQEVLEKRKPQIRDIVLTVLSSKSYAEVSTAQGKLGLKQEIMRRINLVLPSGSINNVYFTQFVSQ